MTNRSAELRRDTCQEGFRHVVDEQHRSSRLHRRHSHHGDVGLVGGVNSTSGPSLRHSRREMQRPDFPNLIIGYAKDTKPTGPRNGLQSGHHPVTKHITGADHNVTDMLSYAEVNVAGLREELTSPKAP